MKKSNIRRILILTFSFILILMITITSQAFDARTGSNVTISAGETVNSDLYISATNITIAGTVNGGVFAVGQNINISGTVNGGITLAAQTISVNGKVSNGARLAGQTVTVGGNIGRDLIVAASDFTVNSSAEVGGDLNAISNSLVVSGHIAGNVRGAVNDASLKDGIDKDVDLTVSNLTITSSANIKGNLRYISQNKAVIQSGAVISGTTSQVLPSTQDGRRGGGILAGILGAILFRIFGFIAIFIIGLIILLFARNLIRSLALAIRDRPAVCLGWGALILFVTPIAAFIVMVTIIGLPLGLLTLVVWGILLYLSQIPVAILIGWLILSRSRDYTSYGFMTGALVLGLLILYVISLIPIFGFIMWFLVMIFGLGSLVVFLSTGSTVSRVTPPVAT